MKVKTINISLPNELLIQIDKKAKEEYKSRSEVLKDASLLYIRTKDNWTMLQNDLIAKAKKRNIQTENDIENLVDSIRE